MQNDNKKPYKTSVSRVLIYYCGERGIRTPGGFHLNGFQDRRIRPLCHLSGAKIGVQPFQKKFLFIKFLNPLLERVW